MASLRSVREWIERRFMGGNGIGGASFSMSGALPAPMLSGIAVTPETALTFVNCFACINVLATDCAAPPLEVKRKRPGGGRVVARKDPRYSLVYCEPNRNTTSMRFRQALYGHKAGWGNAFAEIKRYNGMPVELHLHSPRPSDTWPEKSRNGSLWYQVDGGRRQIRAEDIIHIAGLGWNGLVGYSPIALHRQAVGLGLAMQQFGAAFYGNAATPRGALKVQKKMTPEMLKNLRESIADVHQGTTNAHRLLILEEGMEFQGISVNPEDLQWCESQKLQALDMNRIFRVPPHKTMDYSNAGSAYRALEESNQDYISTTIGPEIEGTEQELNRKLFTSRERAHGLHVAHDFSAMLKGDMKTRAQYLTSRLAMGSITPDQIAEREGDDPVPGPHGKRYFISTNLVPLDQAGTVKPDPSTEPDGDEVDTDNDTETESTAEDAGEDEATESETE